MTIKLPIPDTHCFDEDTTPPADVWSYSPDLVRQIIEADRAQRGEPVAWMSPGKERLEFSRPDTVYGSHTIPLYAAPQPAHTEAEVQELMEFAKHHALGTFSDATIEDKFRRVLGVPKP